MKLTQLIRKSSLSVFLPVLCALTLNASTASAQTGFTYNGIVRAIYGNNDLGSSGDTTYANYIKSTGANYVAITIEWFVQNNTANTIAASSTQSATDAQIVASIKQYHNMGIKVVLKPQVDLINYATWRGELAPSNVSEWFSSYQSYITHYAQLAKSNSVEGFSIGTELKSLSGSQNLSYWKTLISAVRNDYSGTIFYGANATGSGDEYSTVSFWSLVDIIGVDGYFGLTNYNDPSVSALESAWTNSSENSGFNIVAALKALNTKYGKSVVFTEAGYVSSKGTNSQPYAALNNGYDPTEQENCYTAFFEVFKQETSWMKGVFWWDLQLPLPSSNDQSWIMYNKPAGTVMTNNYK